MVLYGRQGRKLPVEEFRQRWGNGALLLLEPDLNRLLEQPEEKRAPFPRFLHLTWPCRFLLLQALAISVVIGLLALTLPLAHLTVRHRHAAGLQPRSSLPERESLEAGEPQGTPSAGQQ